MDGHFRQLLRFCAVGGTCFGLGLGVLAGLHELAGVNYLLAYVASFVVANLAGYLLNARFTFPAASVDHAGAARYLTINALLLLANTGGLKVLVDMAHMWYITAAALLAIVYTPLSFLAQRLITYRLGLRSRAPQI
ncbi:MAG TPA: GtrA family protein [Steroidobacteraceae bacterium]|jgi:putative flippase GtrA